MSKYTSIRLVLPVLILAATVLDKPDFAITKGSLILFLASQDGLIVASDSRANINLGSGKVEHCDNAAKIVPLKNHNRSVVVVAGADKVFYKSSLRSCLDLLTQLPILNITKVAAFYLDSEKEEINATMFKELQIHVLRKVRAVQSLHPELLRNDDDGMFSNVAVGRYIPEKGLSLYARFSISIRPNGKSEIRDTEWHEYHLVDKGEIKALGEGARFAEKHVLVPEGKRQLGYHALYDYAVYNSYQTIQDIPIEAARKAAIDVLESTENSRTT